MSAPDSHGKIFSVLIGLLILAFFFLYLKKSGQLEEIKASFRSMSGTHVD